MKFNNGFYNQIKWLQSLLSLKQLYRLDILKSTFIMSALLNTDNVLQNILRETVIVF